MTELRIGELSRRVGVTVQTVRYYERLGLLRAERRTDAGYRLYGESELGQLRFIRRARAIGMSLGEIRVLLGVAARGQCGPLRREVIDLLQEKIVRSRQQLRELRRLQRVLRASDLDASDSGTDCGCAAFPETCACLPGAEPKAWD